MYCNQGFKNLICGEKIHNRYLFWFLKGKTEYLNLLGRGATFKEISKTIVEKIENPLPPLDVQKHIADTLHKAQEIIDGHKKQLKELDNLIKATFYDMFGDPVKNEKGWTLKPIDSFCMVRIGPFGSLLHVDDYIDGGFPLVNPSHIIDGKVMPDMKLTLNKEKFEELGSYSMHKGDIVIGRRGEIGRCAIVDDEGFLCGTGSMFIRIEKGYLPIVLQHIISSDTIQTKLEHQSVGVTMKNLNAGTISNLSVPLIPFSLQNKFAQIVTNIEEQKSIIKQSITESQNLFNSLMSKYFD